MKFDPKKPVRTRKGIPARVVCTDCQGDYPIIALIPHESGREVVHGYTSGGFLFKSAGTNDYDLINVPEKRMVYINIYERFAGDLHNSRQGARIAAEAYTQGRDNGGKSHMGLLELTIEDGKIVGVVCFNME